MSAPDGGAGALRRWWNGPQSGWFMIGSLFAFCFPAIREGHWWKFVANVVLMLAIWLSMPAREAPDE